VAQGVTLRVSGLAGDFVLDQELTGPAVPVVSAEDLSIADVTEFSRALVQVVYALVQVVYEVRRLDLG